MLTDHIPLPPFECMFYLDRFHGQCNVFARSAAGGTQWVKTLVLYKASTTFEAHLAKEEFEARVAVIKALAC